MTLNLPDDDTMINVWVSVLIIGIILNYLLTNYSYCHMNIPLCASPVPRKSGTGLAYVMANTTETKGKSLKHLQIPITCSKIPLTELKKPKTIASAFGIGLILTALLLAGLAFTASKSNSSASVFPTYMFAGVLGLIGLSYWLNIAGTPQQSGDSKYSTELVYTAAGPMALITMVLCLTMASFYVSKISSVNYGEIRTIATGLIVLLWLVFMFNVKNIYAGFIESALANSMVLVMVLLQVIAIADLLRIFNMNTDDMLMIYSAILAVALVIQLTLYLYNIYKCYRISYKCVPDVNYANDQVVMVGCRAKY